MARAATLIQDEIRVFAEAKNQTSETPDLNEIGSRLADLEMDSDGILTESGDITIDTYRKMRTDPQVKACLLVMKYPILQVDWNMQANSEEGQQLAKWVELMLTDHVDDSVQYYLREMLTALDFGRSITEKVWTLKPVPVDAEDNARVEERIIPLKLKTYDPRNLRIKLDPSTHKLEGVLQDIEGKETLIPANKLLIYSHEKEFGNYYGESALRAAYKPWVIKEFLQKFWNIALERYGTPLQSMSIPQGGSIKAAIELMDMVKSKTGIPLPEGYELEIHSMANAGLSFEQAIKYQDQQIARGMLIPDLVFGNSSGGSGAYALSKTHAGIFLLRLNGITQELGDILTKYLVRPMIRYNFGEVAEYPELKFADVAEEDTKQLAEIIQMMINGKVVAPSEAWIRERLGMPAPDEKAEEYLEAQYETVLLGLENINKANETRRQMEQEGNDPSNKDPEQLDKDKKKAKDDPELKKDAKDKKQDFSEDAPVTDDEWINYFMSNMREASRFLKVRG